jgi:hypothetical protein
MLNWWQQDWQEQQLSSQKELQGKAESWEFVSQKNNIVPDNHYYHVWKVIQA